VERAYSADQIFAQVGEVAEPTFNEGGTASSPLRDSTTYLYRIRAVNRVGAVGEASDPIDVTTRPPPAAPLNLSAMSLEVRCIPLAWEVHPEEDVVRYDVYRADSDVGPFAFIGSAAGRENASYLDGGQDPGNLEDDRTYFYCIRAINAVTAESDDSEVVMATTRPVPPVVEGLATLTGLPRRVELMWNASADDKVIGYDVERTEGAGAPVIIARVSGRETASFEDRGGEAARFMRASVKTPLKDGTSYAYRLRAVNTAEAVSEWCEPAEATPKIVPQIPAGLKASEGRPGVIGVVWAANPEEDIAEYVVEASPLPDRNFIAAGRVSVEETRGLKQENLPPNLTRHYRVKAIDADGLESPWSEPVAGFTKPLPDAPAGLEVEWTDDGAFLRWTAPAQKDIVRYRILNKKMFGQEEVGTAETTEYFFPAEALAQKKVLMVMAVDEDGLESPASKPLEVNPKR
jgi:fibronectin type 3 domain-containing protein